MAPVGTFVCTLEIGDNIFEGIQIAVVQTSAPPLIGMNVLAHPSVEMIEISKSPPQINFHRVNSNSESFNHKVPTSFRIPSESYITEKVLNEASEDEIKKVQLDLKMN